MRGLACKNTTRSTVRQQRVSEWENELMELKFESWSTHRHLDSNVESENCVIKISILR